MTRNGDTGSKNWPLLGLCWFVGLLLVSLLLLLPLRMPFLDVGFGYSITLGEVAHFMAFALLAGAFPLAFPQKLLVLLAPFMLSLLCVLFEFWQLHVPYRRFSELDILAGVLGCIAGTTAGWVLRFRHNRALARGDRGKTTS